MTEECGRPPDKIRGMEAELSLAQFQMLESILETTFPKCPGRPILRQLSEKIKISQNKLRNWFKWRINCMKQSTIDVADEINTGMVTSSSNPMVLNRVIFCPEVIQKYHCNFVPQYSTGSVPENLYLHGNNSQMNSLDISGNSLTSSKGLNSSIVNIPLEAMKLNWQKHSDVISNRIRSIEESLQNTEESIYESQITRNPVWQFESSLFPRELQPQNELAGYSQSSSARLRPIPSPLEQDSPLSDQYKELKKAANCYSSSSSGCSSSKYLDSCQLE